MKYKVREACFACTTPYQVMGAIAITQGCKLDADLFIFGLFPNYGQLSERLRRYGVFANVYAVDCSKIRSPGREKGFLQMVFAKRTVSSFLPKDIAYHRFYSSSRSLIKTILHSVLEKRNPQMRLVIYEDGMGTYSKDSGILNSSARKSTAEKLLRWNLYDPAKTSLMSYLPQLVEVPDLLNGCRVEQMPRLEWSKESRAMMADVFGADEAAEIDNRFIIFDTLRGTNTLTLEGYDLLDQCYRIVTNVAGRENVICKPHPRSRGRANVDIQDYTQQGIPMEILYAGMEDLESRVLIAHISSAVFTPKIMFDKEPVVICLHRILNKERVSGLFEGIFSKFKSSYVHNERVLAPNSLEELERIIKEIA